MSWSLSVISLDLDQLRRARGGRDGALLQRVLREEKDQIAFHDGVFRKPRSPYLPLAKAIAQTIAGSVDPAARPRFQYEHAVAAIARSLGEPLDAEAFAECSDDLWNEINRFIRRARSGAGLSSSRWPAISAILQRGPFVDVPLDAAMRLGTGYLDGSECRTIAQALAALRFEDLARGEELEWPDETVDAAEQYRGWVRHASEHAQGLFFHC